MAQQGVALTDSRVATIYRTFIETGGSLTEVARRCGVSSKTVERYRDEYAWGKELDDRARAMRALVDSTLRKAIEEIQVRIDDDAVKRKAKEKTEIAFRDLVQAARVLSDILCQIEASPNSAPAKTNAAEWLLARQATIRLGPAQILTSAPLPENLKDTPATVTDADFTEREETAGDGKTLVQQGSPQPENP